MLCHANMERATPPQREVPWPVTLSTARLLLRPIESADVPEICRLWTDAVVRRYLGGPVAADEVVRRGELCVSAPALFSVARSSHLRPSEVSAGPLGVFSAGSPRSFLRPLGLRIGQMPYRNALTASKLRHRATTVFCFNARSEDAERWSPPGGAAGGSPDPTFWPRPRLRCGPGNCRFRQMATVSCMTVFGLMQRAGRCPCSTFARENAHHFKLTASEFA